MMKKFICIAAFVLFAQNAFASTVVSIAAIVNDEPITSHDIDREVATTLKEAERKGVVPKESAAELRVLALNKLIDKKLVEQKIRELDIRISEEEVHQAIEDVKKQNNLTQEALVAALRTQGLTFDDYKTQLKEQLERLRLISMEVRSKIQVGEREMREYYAANPLKFGAEEAFRARHIFLRVPKDAKPDDIKRIMANAVSVHNEAKSGADFAELAKKNSDDPTAKEGGSLGTFKKGEMLTDISDAVSKLKAGEVSDLISTPAGFHIIKLEERIPGTPRPFEDVRGEIEETLYRIKSEERFNIWLNDLRKGATIQIKSGTATGN
ncbi:MAG: peptidylprolyl isomerase [Geobacter sp.]|nr:peptidylprolyl isomerase [Geobacter sp.]